jgi:hypothetical protein
MIESSVCIYYTYMRSTIKAGCVGIEQHTHTHPESYTSSASSGSIKPFTIWIPVGGHQLALVHIYIPEGNL